MIAAFIYCSVINSEAYGWKNQSLDNHVIVAYFKKWNNTSKVPYCAQKAIMHLSLCTFPKPIHTACWFPRCPSHSFLHNPPFSTPWHAHVYVLPFSTVLERNYFTVFCTYSTTFFASYWHKGENQAAKFGSSEYKQQAFSVCFQETHTAKISMQHNRVNDFEGGITMHSNSKVSLQVTISCLRQICVVLGNLASNAGHNYKLLRERLAFLQYKWILAS